MGICNWGFILAGRELGRGPLSRVYKGRIGVGRRAVAIKRVDGQDRESAKAFCRELMIASSLRNENIVPLLGFCVDKEGLFLVYKYVSGGSLDHHLHCPGSLFFFFTDLLNSVYLYLHILLQLRRF